MKMLERQINCCLQKRFGTLPDTKGYVVACGSRLLTMERMSQPLKLRTFK